MPQVLKPEVRERIVQSALEVFARDGFAGATMASIGERAEVAAASMYRYFPNKESLFAEAIPDTVATTFRALLVKRVRALAEARGVDDALTGDEMLRFWLDHRLAVVVLLDRAEGTAFASFGAWFVDALVELTTERVRAQKGEISMSAAERFVLRQIFENTRVTIASILRHYKREAEIRDAVHAFWRYQVAGIRGFVAHVER